MKKFYFKVVNILKGVKNKIAFYPTALALLGIFLAFFMLYLERTGISQYFFKEMPVLMVDNGDTALAILGSLITGLISMMVFSFSMVMLLLSQASNNYSPRLLPGLISNKVHQIVLGIFLATILYLIFVLFSIEPAEEEYTIPGFSVLMGILFTVACIYAFIFFIHNISQNIQINHILDQRYQVASTALRKMVEEENQKKQDFPSDKGWFEYYAKRSGYLQHISYPNLTEICVKTNTRLSILPVRGFFVLEGLPLFKSEKELNKEDLEMILTNFHFSRGELVEDNYLYAFKQITEIIVKAMSPGINDPGTAINGIDYITELFSLRLQNEENAIICKNGKALIRINIVHFDELLYNVMASIRTYCKHDIILVQKLLVMFRYLKMQGEQNKKYKDSIEKEVKTLLKDVQKNIANERDIEEALQLAKSYGFETDFRPYY